MYRMYSMYLSVKIYYCATDAVSSTSVSDGQYTTRDSTSISESHKFKQVHDNKNNEDGTGAILTLGEKVASDICSVPT
jgi:hypothetical protein